ncbi:MAG: hypothetical protein LBR55_03490 [Bacteroidales bacterium]|nr:hypothetical protein [Bacteroidales bacterium]
MFTENGIFDYTYSVGNATTIPDITALRSDRELNGSEISITNGSIDGEPSTITVMAEDGSSSSTYKVYFVSRVSDNPRPLDIAVNGVSTDKLKFNGYILDYNVTLPYGTTSCPEITVEKAEDRQTYEIINCNSLPGKATVKVTAADGINTNTYTINLSVAEFEDNTLQDILIDGKSIANFKPTLNNYTIQLPAGTTQTPEITAISAYEDGLQTIIVARNDLSAPSTIRVFPTNNSSFTRTYKLNFEVASSSYVYLDDLQIGGVSLEDFNPETLTYNYVLPRGTAALPAITYTLGEQNQIVSIIPGDVNGTTLIKVDAENGNAVVYRINFSVLKSDNSRLNDILIGGESIAGFNPNTLEYDIELPSGTTTMPEIAVVQGDEFQSVRITNNGLNAVSLIRVSAENGASSTYSLKFSVTLSASSQLNSILIAGEEIEGFSPEILSYNYILPADASKCPDIEAIKESAGQQVFIIKPELTGIATIRVASETAGGGENIYTVNFQFELPDDNFLESITIGGIPLVDFDSSTNSYTVDLPQYSNIPNVEYSLSDPLSRIFIIKNGLRSTQISVTAQNGETNTYSINYNVAPTNNVNLADIEIWDNSAQNFVSLVNFDAQTTEYEYSLPWRTNTVPAINPVAAENGQKITVFYNPVNETTEIKVIAPDGISEKTYLIDFPVEKSNYAYLNSITIDGSEINFIPQMPDYNINLPYGTSQTPQVSFEKGKIGGQTVFEQTVEITAGSLNEPYTLKVTAEDGSTQTYTLNFKVDISTKIGENGLNMILVGDVPVDNFNSENFDYSFVLPYGTTELPEFKFEKKYPEQTVVTDIAGVYGTAKVKVYSNIAGVPNTEYSIKFSVSDIPTTTLNSISFNGVAVNFDPKVHSYIVPVERKPNPGDISYSYNTNELYVDESETYSREHHKKFELTVSNLNDENDTNTYTFWYYYTNDVIPNPSFENWSNGAVNTGKQKPTSWKAPIDVINQITCFLIPYTTGADAVNRSATSSDGLYSAYLRSTYAGSSTQDYPGVITLGTFNNSGACLGSHSSSVNGGIDFKNTPDAVSMDYMYDKGSKGSENMRFVFQLWNTGANFDNGQNVSNFTYTDGTNRTNWYTMNQPVIYNNDNRYPQRMNIIINANNTENTKNMYGAATTGSKLTADNVRFGYNSTLSNVYVNGDAVASFDGSQNNLSFPLNIPAETMAPPVISFDNAVPDQEVRVTISGENPSNRQRTVEISSKAENNITITSYTLLVNRPVAAVSTLAGISVGNTPLADFEPNKFEYEVTVPSGTMFLPDVFVTKGEGHQSVSYSLGNKQIIINVTAENGSDSQTYTLNFVTETLTSTALLNLEVSGYEITFDAETLEYNVVLPAEELNIPQILFTKQYDEQIVKLRTSGVNGTSLIRVETVQNEDIFTEYKINFSTEAVETSELLSGISLVNIPLIDFDPNKFDYSVQINENKKFVFSKEFASDEMNVIYLDDAIECNIGENTYKIVFEAADLDNAYLADIAIDGISLNDFEKTKLDYAVVWDKEYMPVVTVESALEGQTITHVWEDNSISILVVAPDGVTENEYKVIFKSSVISSYSLLADILIDGISLEDFIPSDFTYAVELPEDATQNPTIQAVVGEKHQTIISTESKLDDKGKGKITITVTAEDAVSQSVYVIDFKVRLSDNALLNEILIDYELIASFDPEMFEYYVTLPYSKTPVLPAVDYVKGHARQSIEINNEAMDGVTGQYVIIVTSESGATKNEYVINFDMELSPNVFLENILADGEEIPNFFPEIEKEYEILVPCGTTEVPEITWTAENEGQVIEPTYAETLDDVTKLRVIAANGTDEATYTISFKVIPSRYVLLDDIFIGSKSLKELTDGFISNVLFDAEVFEYKIELPFGTSSLPEITAIAQGSEECSTVEIDIAEDWTTTIEVISNDGKDVSTYTLTFTVGLSKNSKLDHIHINELPLEGFHRDTIEYVIYYPIGTNESELINSTDAVKYIRGDEHQDVDVNIYEDNTIVLIVTAQNGDRTAYAIKQVILKSDNALLADIIIDGKSFADFEPTKFDYVYQLPFSASAAPDFVGIKQEESQEVEHYPNPLGKKSQIYVIAEDGNTFNVYTIMFVNTTENPGDTPNKDNVCFTINEDGAKFASNRNNVSILIFNMAGRMVFKSEVPISDPNDNICQSNGVIFRGGKKGEIYIYMFVHNEKTRIKDAAGKFLLTY